MTVYNRLARIYKEIVLWNMRIVLAFFCMVSIVCTCTIASDISERTYFVDDKAVRNIVLIGISIIVLAAIKYYMSKRQMTVSINFDWIILTIFAISLSWILMAGLSPLSDQRLIYGAVYSLKSGDYSIFSPGEYFDRNPQQTGLLLLYYLYSLVFGFKSAIAYQAINVVAIAVFYKKYCDVCEHIGLDEKYRMAIGICGILFYPLIMYCTFIYGTLLGLAFSMAAIDNEIVFFRKGMIRNALLSALFIAMGIVSKTNFLIFLIAMIIVAVFELIRTRKAELGLYVVLLLVVLLTISSIPPAITRKMTGTQEGSAISSWAFVAMGLQEGSRANGWHNSYDYDSYVKSGNDGEIQKEKSLEYLRERLREFRDNPGYTAKFFFKKIVSQWNNPTFECYSINQVMEPEAIQSDLVKAFLSKEGSAKAYGFLDLLLMLMYIGAFLAFCLLDFSEPYELIFPTIFIGGFLFHIVWEGKCQYTIPYFVLLLGYAIAGFNVFLDRLLEMRTIIVHKDQKTLVKILMPIMVCAIIMIVCIFAADFVEWDNDIWHQYLSE